MVDVSANMSLPSVVNKLPVIFDYEKNFKLYSKSVHTLDSSKIVHQTCHGFYNVTAFKFITFTTVT